MDLFDKFSKKKSLFKKGINLQKQGKYEESLEYFDKALKIDPKYDKAWYNKGYALVTCENLKIV